MVKGGARSAPLEGGAEYDTLNVAAAAPRALEYAPFRDTVPKSVVNILAGPHRRDFKKLYDKSKIVAPGMFHSVDLDAEAIVALLGQVVEKTYATYHRSLRNIEESAQMQMAGVMDSRSISVMQQDLEDAKASARRFRCEKKLIEDMYSRHMYVFDMMHPLATTVVDQWRKSGAPATSELEQLTVFLRQNKPSKSIEESQGQLTREELEQHLSMIPHLADVLEDYTNIQEQQLRVNRKYKAVKTELAVLRRSHGLSLPCEGPPVEFGSGAGASAGGKRKKQSH